MPAAKWPHGLTVVGPPIRIVRPAGVDSKTKTDKGDTHTKDLQKVELFERAAKQAAA
jgi:phosphoribosylanthranilate isomerase